MRNPTRLLKPRKIRSILLPCVISVQSSSDQAAILRVVSGDGCEIISCYQVATWVVTYNDETHRLCPKHTMLKMRDASIWGNTTDGKIEASAD